MVSSRLPRVSAKVAIRALERDGWDLVRTSGSHKHFKHPVKPGLVTVPDHAGETLYPKLLKSILLKLIWQRTNSTT